MGAADFYRGAGEKLTVREGHVEAGLAPESPVPSQILHATHRISLQAGGRNPVDSVVAR